ncbi:hypothetical protein HDV04_001161 [Boothiomyces sp. JEL0838]|nr:hypothetical protein HDV04_001161 [Boothiomyces sp. JEL0838]
MFSNKYQFQRREKLVDKENHFFVGAVSDISGFKVQEEEVEDYQWVPIAESLELVTFDTDKQVLVEIMNELKK